MTDAAVWRCEQHPDQPWPHAGCSGPGEYVYRPGRWSYAKSDPGIRLFTTCLDAGAPMRFAPGMRILEVGCCEADWLSLAAAAWPECHFTGLDWRAPNALERGVSRIKANGLDATLFKPGQFDAIVSLSAIEHFGLGHYDSDPLDPDGDSVIMANCRSWLAPGGWMYFDVPYDPTRYRVINTEARVYDGAALIERLRVPFGQCRAEWRGYVEAGHEARLVDPPTQPVHPFHYAACVWEKAL